MDCVNAWRGVEERVGWMHEIRDDENGHLMRVFLKKKRDVVNQSV
jgi:hypothetical protein